MSGAVVTVGLAAYLVGVVVGLFVAAFLRSASDPPEPRRADEPRVPDYVPAEWTRAGS